MVIGMHRSGTSALTRALNLLGFSAPRNILGVEEHNETGHWEPERIVATHEEMLSMCDSHWDDWRPLDLSALSIKQQREYKDRLLDQLRHEFGDLRAFALKDPRVCRFLPFYKELLKSLGVEAYYVIPFRNPLEVCESLYRRNKMTRAYASLVWLRHVVDAEYYSRNHARSFCDYHELLNDHKSTLSKIRTELKITWPVSVDLASEALDNHLKLHLKHHAANLDDLQNSTEFNAWVKDAFEALLVLKNDNSNAAAMAQLDTIREAFNEAAQHVGAATFVEHHQREHRLSKKVAQQAIEHEKITTKLREDTNTTLTKIDRLELSLNEKSKELIASEKEILETKNRTTKEICSINKEIDSINNENIELKKQIQRSEAWSAQWKEKFLESDRTHSQQIHSLTSSTSWQITRPIRGVKRVLTERGFAKHLLRSAARTTFFAIPMSSKTRQMLLKRYHDRRLRNTMLAPPPPLEPVPVKPQNALAHTDIPLESHQPALEIAEDGRWNADTYEDQQDLIRKYLGALSRPEDEGPVLRSDMHPNSLLTGPKVSLIVRTYAGRWPLLKIALQSIANQSYRPIEVLVIEDGSSSLKKKVLNFKNTEDLDIHFFAQPKMGRSNTANIGLNNVSGDLIGFLDDDDYLLPDHCSKLAGFAESRTDLAAVYSAALELSADLDPKTNTYGETRTNAVFMAALAHSSELMHRNGFPIQSVLFRRSVCTKHDRFNLNLNALEDWLFWMRMLTGHRIGAIADITSAFYVPRSQAIHKKRIQEHITAEPFLIVQRNAFYEERRLTDMEPVNIKLHQVREKALERITLDPIENVPSSQGIKQNSPLEQVLGQDKAPETEPRFTPKIAAYTSINLRYLPKALAWAKSVKAYNPDWETHILLNDAVPNDADTWPDVDVVYPISKLDVPHFHSWAFSMRVVELCTATKPFYAKKLLNSGFEHVFYFDPDTHAYSDLNQLIDEFGDNDVLITPHCCEDAFADAEIHYSEMSSLAHGLYNLGFLGLKQSKTGHEVADFWCRRLLRHCADDHGRGLFTDQKWFNLVPIYFDRVKILKHKGCNTASWNIANRQVTMESGKWYAGGEPLVFFHFSGYDKNVPRAMFDVFGGFNDDLENLISDYDHTNQLFERRFPVWKSEWALASYNDGTKVADSHREIYKTGYQNQLAYETPYYTGPNSYKNYLDTIGPDAIEQQTTPSGFIRRYF